MTEIPLEEVELKFSKFFGMEYGGQWKPQDCRPRWKVGPCTTTHVRPRSDDTCAADVDWLLLSTETYAVSRQRSRQKPTAELVW